MGLKPEESQSQAQQITGENEQEDGADVVEAHRGEDDDDGEHDDDDDEDDEDDGRPYHGRQLPLGVQMALYDAALHVVLNSIAGYAQDEEMDGKFYLLNNADHSTLTSLSF